MEFPLISDEDYLRVQVSKLVECPICYESMTHTEMCVNGHTVCLRCRQQLDKCPVCNKAFGNIRNRLGESVAELLAFKRCGNAVRGCSKFLADKDNKKHEEECRYRLYNCKVCSLKLCFAELKGHIMNDHQNSFIQPFVTKEIADGDASEGQLVFSLVEFSGELFWFWRKYSKEYVYFGVQYCGELQKRLSYKYNLQLVSKSRESDFEFTGPTLPDVKSFNHYNYSEDYVVLSKSFMEAGAKFQISVAKV